MKSITFSLTILSVIFLFSCTDEAPAEPEPFVEAEEKGVLFSYSFNAGFYNREFTISLFSSEAEFHSVDFFLEDFQEKTYNFGINTFNEAILNDNRFISTDSDESNTGFLTIEKINWQDSTFSGIFEFSARTAPSSSSSAGASYKNGVLRDIPFTDLGGNDEKLCRISMNVNGEQRMLRTPICFWQVSDTALILNSNMHPSFLNFHIGLLKQPTGVGVYNIEDLQNFDFDFEFPDMLPGNLISQKGSFEVIKNDPTDFLLEFNFDFEYEFENFILTNGVISIE